MQLTKEELAGKLIDYARDARAYAQDGGEYYTSLSDILTEAAQRILKDPWSDVR